jgi:uncharacterized protein
VGRLGPDVGADLRRSFVMIAVDSNILVYAHRRECELHDKAKYWLEGLIEQLVPWAIPWPCVHEFLANVTNARIYRDPTPMHIALHQAEQWMMSPTVVMLGEADDYWSFLKSIIATASVSGARIHDAKIAALVLSHGVAHLATCDRDFSRFVGISTINPLHDRRVHEGKTPRRKSRTG